MLSASCSSLRDGRRSVEDAELFLAQPLAAMPPVEAISSDLLRGR